ncbi:hypothetical protein GCM10022196_05930 [Aeromicrobium flavum]
MDLRGQVARERVDGTPQRQVGGGDVHVVERDGLVLGDALHGIHEDTVDRVADTRSDIAHVLWTDIAQMRYGPGHARTDRA